MIDLDVSTLLFLNPEIAQNLGYFCIGGHGVANDGFKITSLSNPYPARSQLPMHGKEHYHAL
jgi:hypothetical protein